MPVLEDTLKEEDAILHPKLEEQAAPSTALETSETGDVVTEIEDVKPAKKKKKFKVRLNWQVLTSLPDRATDEEANATTGPILEDGTACIEKQDLKSDDGDGLAEEKEDAHDTSDVQVPKPLPTLAYEEVTRFSRTMHYSDFSKCFKAKRFITSKIQPRYNTVLNVDGNFVWFRAESGSSSSEAHDWYGNVRCSFDLLQYLQANKNVNLFYVDCAYFGFSSATRILLTSDANFSGGTKMDLKSLKYGDPLMYDGEKLVYLRRDVNRNKEWFGGHQTELVIDASTIDISNLFELCEKTAVNHFRANRRNKSNHFLHHQCLIYNSRSKNCPSAWSVELTQQCMDDFLTM